MKKIFLILIVCLVFCSGCASIHKRSEFSRGVGSVEVYPGVKNDIKGLVEVFTFRSKEELESDYSCGYLSCAINYKIIKTFSPIIVPLSLVDLTFSTVVDTVLFPADYLSLKKLEK